MVSVLKGTLSCTLMLNAFALVLRGSVIAATRDGFPPNFVELECGVHAIALQFGVRNVAGAGKALYDALNLGNCSQHLSSAQMDDIRAALQRARQDQTQVAILLRAGKYCINTTLSLGTHDSFVTWSSYQNESVVLSGGQRLQLKWEDSSIRSEIKVANVPTSMHTVLSPAEQVYWNQHRARYTRFVNHCMNRNNCKDTHCDCGDPPDQLADNGCDSKGNVSDCVAVAYSKCKATAGCLSFAVMNNGGSYELFALNNWSSVSNSDWTSYALNAATPPPPAPAPPAPPPHSWGPPPALWNTLHVNGVRQVRARFPNANPQHEDGLCFSKANLPGEGCDNWLSAHGSSGSLPGSTKGYQLKYGLNRNLAPATRNDGSTGSYGTFQYTIYDPPQGHPVYNKPLPDRTWTNNSYFSFWGDLLSRPANVNYGSDITKTYKTPQTGVVHMFHSGLWGGWQYQLSGQDSTQNLLLFGYGGYQEARGSGIKSNHYYVENLLEELDAAGEWYYDPVESKVYFWPNTTEPLETSEVVAPTLSAIARVEGATNVAFVGITFTETRATFLDQYEVPSGGDWSVHRGAAVEIVDSTSVTVTNCTFNQVGGNGVLLSNDASDNTISHNEFVYTGDSGIVAVGTSDGFDGTGTTYPANNDISNNHIHEIGVYGKQTSCYFQALGQNNRFANNLCYNGPRAGINWNDGFAGGSTVEGNLVFNMVRETGDHGPYNSWDRQPYLTRSGVEDGYPSSAKLGLANASVLKKRDVITKNLFINGYNGVWTIDHDDGSQYFNDTMNFMVFGKNYMGCHKSCDHNVIVHPGIPERSSGNRRCQTDDNKVFQEQYHDNNHCFTQDGDFYSMDISACDAAAIDPHVYQTFNNTLYAPASAFSNGPCSTFAKWQGAGQDIGSRVLPLPDASEILAMGKNVLQ